MHTKQQTEAGATQASEKTEHGADADKTPRKRKRSGRGRGRGSKEASADQSNTSLSTQERETQDRETDAKETGRPKCGRDADAKEGVRTTRGHSERGRGGKPKETPAHERGTDSPKILVSRPGTGVHDTAYRGSKNLKPHRDNDFVATMRRWKVGDFMCQLLTVIIGIVVTFGGNALIQRGAAQKEARQVLTMVSDELGQHLATVKEMREWFTYKSEGAKAIKPYLNDPRSVALDLPHRYPDIWSSRLTTMYTNALEVLKGSSSVMAISDKDLLRAIFAAYDRASNFDRIVAQIAEFDKSCVEEYFDKMEVGGTAYETLDEPDSEAHMRNSVAQFVEMVKDPRVVKYIVYTASDTTTNQRLSLTDSTAVRLTRTLEMIDKVIN